jgi:YD repeat-containing protein
VQERAPANTDHVELSLWVSEIDSGDAIDIALDDALVEKTATVGDYFDGESSDALWDGAVNASTSTLRLFDEVAVEATYTYNGAAQRTQSSVEVGAQTTTTTYKYSDELLRALHSQETGGEGFALRYLYDEEQRPYAGIYLPDEGEPVFFALVCDEAGNVVELLDADGESFAAYRYDAWGAPLAAHGESDSTAGIESEATQALSEPLASEIAERQVLRAASLPANSESGLVYARGNYYHPETGLTVEGGEGVYAYQLAAEVSQAAAVEDGPLENWFEYPTGSGNLLKNYDYFYRPENGKWIFDHPVSLIIRARKNVDLTVKRVDSFFESSVMKYGSKRAKFGTGSIGRLGVSLDSEPAFSSTESILKRSFDDWDCFYHTRFYAPNDRCFEYGNCEVAGFHWTAGASS